MNSNYTFFWSGPFSQWYESKFIKNGIKFNTAEQYMMYNKATLFDDFDIAEKILKTNNPKIQKGLGRQVSNFNLDVWNQNAKRVVYEGNYCKFTQNPDLLQKLLSTEGTILVEASPFDSIWGIGLSEDVARITPPEQWKGTNWLGEVLTQLRDDLLSK